MPLRFFALWLKNSVILKQFYRAGRHRRWPQRIDPLATMPTEEPERTAEAVRRALPELAELAKLDRYESEPPLGATGRSDRSSKKDQVATADQGK